jgi:polysaccharide biosynthesis/export protein
MTMSPAHILIIGILFAALPARPEVRQYILGPEDQLLVRALEVVEFSTTPTRIDERGIINLPPIGEIEAGGKTINQVKAEVTLRLKKYVHAPQVSVSIAEFRPRPVSIFGAVARPGVVHLHGPKTLWELVSDAGGFKNEVGERIRITRRVEQGEIPLDGAQIDPTGRYYTVELATADVREMKNPDTNIDLMERDAIVVSTADIIYVVGHVNRAGGFVANGSMSVLEALSLSGGYKPHAKSKQSAILRIQQGTDVRRIIPVNLKQILNGRGEDIVLKPQDILFVPHNAWADFGVGLARTAVAAATSAAIYTGVRY